MSITLNPVEAGTSELLQRRQRESMAAANEAVPRVAPITPQKCEFCEAFFSADDPIVNAEGGMWHTHCFVCAQCFEPLQSGQFFKFGDRFYCQYDFQQLYCPICQGCREYIHGRVIKALGDSWHPECFICSKCSRLLESEKFTRFQGSPFCQPCRDEVRNATGELVPCYRCKSLIMEKNERLKYHGEFYHAYHFQCYLCKSDLTADAKEHQGELYCIRCFDKMGIPFCHACRRPVEERVVWALGHPWHTEHFVCRTCEKPFLGSVYFEFGGSAYCEPHFVQVRGQTCFHCGHLVKGDSVQFSNKLFCGIHFLCTACDKVMDEKTKVYEVDMKPFCDSCYRRMPAPYRKRLEKLRQPHTTTTGTAKEK